MCPESQIIEESVEGSQRANLAKQDIRCQLSLSIHAIVEMESDNLSDADVKDAIVSGTKFDNDYGDGDKYQKGCITVIADNKPCHFNVITAWKEGGITHSPKDKNYRRNRYERRKRKELCSRCEKGVLHLGMYPFEISGQVIGEFEGFRCSNCGMVYFSEKSTPKIREILKKFSMRPLDPTELIFILLCSSKRPVKGAISLMKASFLLFKEKLKEFNIPAISPNYIPYYYGPYSFDIDQSLYSLEKNGLISIKGTRSSNKESFILTDKGRKEAREIYDSLPDDLKENLRSWRRGIDEMGNDGILKDVYKKYEDYTVKSGIKDKVLPKWARKRA